jgi:hypothetical protein
MQRDVQPVYDADFSPDDRLLVLAAGDSARIWDVATGRPVSQPLQHDDLVYSAAFSPDAKLVVTASADRTAQIWDAMTGKLTSSALQHTAPVNWAAFSPDGRYVVTACDDHTARIWDVATGRPLGCPLQHAERVISAEFSPNGQHVVTACVDGTAQIWNINYIRILADTDTECRRMLAPLLEAISETKIIPQSDRATRFPDDLHWLRDRLVSSPDTLHVYRDLFAWYFYDPMIRPVWPESAHTVPQLIDGLRRINRPQPHQIAYELNPSDPLTLLTIAGDEQDLLRREFHSRYAIQRLPNDAVAYANAIHILRMREDEVLAKETLTRARMKFPRFEEIPPY